MYSQSRPPPPQMYCCFVWPGITLLIHPILHAFCHHFCLRPAISFPGMDGSLHQCLTRTLFPGYAKENPSFQLQNQQTPGKLRERLFFFSSTVFSKSYSHTKFFFHKIWNLPSWNEAWLLETEAIILFKWKMATNWTNFLYKECLIIIDFHFL